jgi:hypothetical protein
MIVTALHFRKRFGHFDGALRKVGHFKDAYRPVPDHGLRVREFFT